LALSHDEPQAKPDYFIGPVPLPTVPFAVVMSGTDAAGAPVQRQSATIFQSQPVEVAFPTNGPLLPLVPGTTRSFAASIRNAGGAPAPYALNVSAQVGELRSLSPPTLTLGAGESGQVTFTIDVPNNARPSILAEVHLTASQTSDAARYNTAALRLEITTPDDLDGDRIANASDNCPEFPNAD